MHKLRAQGAQLGMQHAASVQYHCLSAGARQGICMAKRQIASVGKITWPLQGLSN